MNKYIFITTIIIIIIILFIILIFWKKKKKIMTEGYLNYNGQFNKKNILDAISKVQGSSNPMSTLLKLNNPIISEEETIDQNNNSATIKNNEDNQKTTINPTINKLNNSIAPGSCRYVSSISSIPNCPAGFESYTGASIGIKDGQMSCSGNIIGNEPAEAVAVLEDKSISKIFVTNGGTNYQKAPNVSIIGNGKLASAEAEIENGKVVSIKITNPGRDYTRPPKILFSKSDNFVYCHLCCKK